MNIEADEERFKAAGLLMERVDDHVTLTVADRISNPAQHVLCRVSVSDGNLVFVPKRAASHRQALAMLGIQTVPG